MSWTAAKRTQDRQAGENRARPEGVRLGSAPWSAAFYRAKGWARKEGAQREQQDLIAAGLLRMERQAAPAGGAAALRTTDAQAPQAFRPYVDMLALLEVEAPPRAPQSIEKLRLAAHKYLAFDAKLPPAAQGQPAARQRRAECERKLGELRGYNLRAEFKALGDPPWGSQTAMKAASLQATFDFESLPQDSRVAEKLSGSNANPAFWVNKAGAGGNAAKSFLFKPTAPIASLGFPEGGDSAREAMAGRQADLLGAMTGLSFGVPETQIVALGRERFGAGVLDAVQPGGPETPVIGSLQQFAAGGKELRGFSTSMRDRFPTETCQKLAILDIVMLNCDRHAGNLLQTGTEDQPDLVPIDHGCCFPGKDDVFGTMARIGLSGSNALLNLPGTHQPFTPAMLTAIGKIDPAAMVRTLSAERDTMAGVHPQTRGMIGDDALEISRRAAVFLQLAAPTMSPGAIQFTFGQHRSELFNLKLDDSGFRRAAQEVLALAAPQQAAIREYLMMPPGEQEAMETQMKALGWGEAQGWLKSDLAAAMTLFKTGTPRPNSDQRPIDIDDNTPAELAALQAEFPDRKIDPTNQVAVRRELANWRAFKAYGGRAALPAAIDRLKLRGPKRSRALQDLGEATVALRNADALARAQEADANNAEPWRKAREYLDTLADIMPRGAQPTFRQELARLDLAIAAGAPAPDATRDVRRIKNEGLDLIRMHAVMELEQLRTPLLALIGSASQGADGARREKLDRVRKDFEESIVFVQGCLFGRWEADRDRLKGYVDAGAVP